jgi:hypothetical protein
MRGTARRIWAVHADGSGLYEIHTGLAQVTHEGNRERRLRMLSYVLETWAA